MPLWRCGSQSRGGLGTWTGMRGMALWAAGSITPRVDRTYPFERAADAHRRILSHGNTGKIILVP